MPKVLKMSRMSKDKYYLDIALAVSKRSTCLKRHYGAVIVKNNEIISTGYNGAPRGISNCINNNKCTREFCERGTGYENCIAVHAEMNAIISSKRSDMIGSSLYLVGKEIDGNYVKNGEPCSICKKIIINAGIEKVIIRIIKNEYKIINTKNWERENLIGGY